MGTPGSEGGPGKPTAVTLQGAPGRPYGFHPILVTCDNTGELLAIQLRPGNAGANTAADHLDVLAEAFAQIPAAHRRRLLVRGDSAAATHAVLDWLIQQGAKRGRQVEYSIGWAIGEPERTAIAAIPTSGGHQRSTPTAASARVRTSPS